MKNELDLYEVILSAEIDHVQGRILKYRVKQTYHNFIQLALTTEQENHSYTHRTLGMSGRLPVTELNKISAVGFRDSYDHCYRVVFTMQGNLDLAQKCLMFAVEQAIRERHERTKQLVDTWNSQPVKFNSISGPAVAARVE